MILSPLSRARSASSACDIPRPPAAATTLQLSLSLCHDLRPLFPALIGQAFTSPLTASFPFAVAHANRLLRIVCCRSIKCSQFDLLLYIEVLRVWFSVLSLSFACPHILIPRSCCHSNPHPILSPSRLPSFQIPTRPISTVHILYIQHHHHYICSFVFALSLSPPLVQRFRISAILQPQSASQFAFPGLPIRTVLPQSGVHLLHACNVTPVGSS